MRYTLGLVALMLLVSSPSPAAEKFISIGTADELGVYYPAGGAICRLVKRGMQEHGLRCFVETTGGSIDNVNAIRQEQQDLGFTQSGVAYQAYHGTGEFASQKPFTKLRVLFGLHTEVFTALVRKDSPIHSFKDLQGKRVYAGAAGSGTKSVLEEMSKAEGWGKQAFKDHEEIKASDQAKALCGKKVDAVVFTAGQPNGAIQDDTTACPVRIIPVMDKAIEAMLAKNPYYHKVTIPAGMYRGVTSPVSTFGVQALLVASEDEDENNVYDVVKAVFDNLDNFKTLHPVFASLTREGMVQDTTGIPLHPGALRFYKEVGLVK